MDEKIKKLLQVAGRIKPGSVFHITVAHDDGCPALKTHSLFDCTCEPEIREMGGNDRSDRTSRLYHLSMKNAGECEAYRCLGFWDYAGYAGQK